MKTIVFLYNVRHHYPDPHDFRHQIEADFDDPETTKIQINYLKKLGVKVIPIEANDQAYLELYRLKDKIDLVFNVSEGIFGKDRESHFPAVLEMMQVPYTGSGPLTQGLMLNKARAKDVLIANSIPTLPYQLLTTGDEPLEKKLKFPLIVKPVAQGSSAGITNKSIVFNEQQLRHQVKKVLKYFNQEVIVEHYLVGREFSVAMLGNPPEILPIIESDHSQLPKKYYPIDSLEVKWIFEEQGNSEYLHCPAKTATGLKNKLVEISLKTWRALDVLDWCRIDIRCDKQENPYVLEINSPPGIIPPEISTTSYFPLAARNAGMDYGQLLKTIINIALKRHRHK